MTTKNTRTTAGTVLALALVIALAIVLRRRGRATDPSEIINA